jgi:deoxyadenosine/deoxycytidine kinase
VYTDSAVFAKMLFDDKKIEEIEYKIYLKWVNEFIADFPPAKFIYVRAEPEVSYQRVLHRGRQGETIPLDYLQNCHLYHDEWLFKTNTNPLLVLDANVDINKNSQVLAKWMHDINCFIYQ